MKDVVNCRQMKALDAAAIRDMGMPSLVLMERAALRTAQEIREGFHEKPERSRRTLVVCGSGNNGGDGIAVARILHLWGFCAEIFYAGSLDRMTEETGSQKKIADNYHVPVVNNPEWGEYTTIVDAIFGVGLGRPVEGRYAQYLSAMNRTAAWRVAVDIPSGVDGDSGAELGIAFQADLTVTFAFRKAGLCFYPGRRLAGRIVVADIGIYASDAVPVWARHLEKADLALLPKRDPAGNKGTFGKVLLAAGSKGMCGAACFSAEAALRAGAGMVKIHTAPENLFPLQTLLPEAMLSCSFSEEENRKNLDWCDVLVIGPGLGISAQSQERTAWYLEHAAQENKPVILDADGLNLLAGHEEWNEFLRSNVILTPHLGEMARLVKKGISEIQGHLPEIAGDYARKTGAVCVLKDACTVVADPQGKTYLNLSGNAGMATAGSGDVLAGILAALCGRTLSLTQRDYGFLAAQGVFLHGICGDLAADRLGMEAVTARDIIRMLAVAGKVTMPVA